MGVLQSLGAASVLAAALCAQSFETGPPAFLDLLQTKIGFPGSDLTGQAAAILLPVPLHSEIAVAGVERLNVPLEFFLNAFHKMPVFKHGQQVLLTGEFGDPPRAADLQLFTPPDADLQALPNCTPGHCSVKLSAAMMDRFRGAAAVSAADFRAAIVQFVARYLQQGAPAMITYADKSPPVASADQFEALRLEVPWLNAYAPPLDACLASFPGSACRQVESFVYWSSAKFGLKPVFSVTQVMLYRVVKSGLPWVFIAFKQIYADHYFDGSIGVAVVVEQSSAPANPALWVLYVNRSRTDALGGLFGPLKRSIAQGRSRKAVETNLVQLRTNLESRYAQQPSR